VYICLCKGLTKNDLQGVDADARQSADTLVNAIGWRDRECCGRCLRNAGKLLTLANGPEAGKTTAPRPAALAAAA
jgi:bacterioferritin-associated ferredoxin